jgi:hypothetical protein
MTSKPLGDTPIKLTPKKLLKVVLNTKPYATNRVPLKLFLLYRTLAFIRKVCRCQKGYDRDKISHNEKILYLVN